MPRKQSGSDPICDKIEECQSLHSVAKPATIQAMGMAERSSKAEKDVFIHMYVAL